MISRTWIESNDVDLFDRDRSLGMIPPSCPSNGTTTWRFVSRTSISMSYINKVGKKTISFSLDRFVSFILQIDVIKKIFDTKTNNNINNNNSDSSNSSKKTRYIHRSTVCKTSRLIVKSREMIGQRKQSETKEEHLK